MILDLNPAALAILGVAGTSLRQRPLAALLEGFPLDADGVRFRAALAQLGETGLPLAAELATADQRRIELNAMLVRDARGEPVGQCAVLRDRSEERRFERLVRQTQRLQTVGTLVAGIAHEVNNPLAFIHANLIQIQRLGELAEAHRTGPEAKLAAELADLGPIAAETLDGIERIERIVADMRRLSTSRDECFARIDLNDVARDAIRLANLHRDASIAIDVAYAPEPLWLEGSAQRLVQAVLNVLMNARQALGRRREGHIALRVRADAEPGRDRGERRRSGHRGGAARADLRSFFYDQGSRPGDGPRPRRGARDRARPRRRARRTLAPGRGRDLLAAASGARGGSRSARTVCGLTRADRQRYTPHLSEARKVD